MGIFSAIMNKLRQHGSQRSDTQQTSGSVQQAQSAAQQSHPGQQQAQPFGQAGQQGASQASMQNVDIDAVLSQLAGQKGGGGNYRQSIVDLLKLLDLDSSMNARKELAEELNVHVGAHGSAEQNIALHKAVMRKIEENGGKVPESMKH
ncbi:MAG TPA: DUF3597 domain-containing protein [Burkholderiales bacterium]|nr:DUF3597 domain-containing protein [Burkholderiales bacterium]